MNLLADLLRKGEVRIVVSDLVLFEVLRGFRHETPFRLARQMLENLSVETATGARVARVAAQHHRSLRARGITVRNGIDVVVAAFCIQYGYALLHRDQDFAAFEQFRGLRAWPH